MHLVCLSGSVRADSSNSRLLRAAARLAPAGTQATLYDRQIEELPIFSPDLDEEGSTPPEAVAHFRALLRQADAILICCPEYAHGVPGAFKNALDWIVSSGELTDKPVALIAASPSGAPYARAGLLPTLQVMGAKMVFDASLVLTRHYVDADGHISDSASRQTVQAALDALLGA